LDSHKTYSDEQLLALLKADDELAFTILLDRYQRKVYKQALTWLKDTQWAEEITQDVFLKIWSKRDSLSTVSKFDGYLFILCKNIILNSLECSSKKAILKRVVDLPDAEIIDPSYSADKIILLKDAQNTTATIINSLPPVRRKVFIMNRFEGLTYEEIARDLNISRSGVRDHMVKALQFLRKATSSEMICLILILSRF
jgi:RNA polymerase sigma-70 factor (family 1)